ncbi:MAG: hypothetical protein HZB85_10915 [Deltaproteobacteria bacterium]|nr:hypothetical protein [Deltaproteobacteria bacterium]
MTPVIGDAIEGVLKNTLGKAIDGFIGKYLPPSMTEEKKAEIRQAELSLAMEQYKLAIADVQGGRELAAKESDGAPAWTKALTVTHRPAWSFAMLGIFGWTVVAPYFSFPVISLTEVHKDIMQTVIIFYFGGRSIEKVAGMRWG